MRDNCLNIEEVKEIKNRIDFILNLMEHYGKEEIKLVCNTYGVHGDYISIAGKGFLPLYEDIEYEYPETLCELGLKEEED